MRKLYKGEITHRGAIISPSIYFGFEWEHPEHVDASWDGDGWDTCGFGHCNTVEECKEEIDEFLAELEELEAE